MARHNKFNVMNLVHACVGSYLCSDSLEEIMERLFPGMDHSLDCTMEELKLFDSIVFMCPSCGYWYRQTDRDLTNDIEWTCKECK